MKAIEGRCCLSGLSLRWRSRCCSVFLSLGFQIGTKMEWIRLTLIMRCFKNNCLLC